jgi:hypothetical protein
MKVMVMIKANTESEAGVLPSQELLSEMGKFNEELVKAGILLAAEGLHPSSMGKRVRFSKKGLSVHDGPFTETKELIAGFWIWKVKSMDEAVAWAKRIPNPDQSEGDIELRQVFEFEEFAPCDPTGELRAGEARMREQIQRQQ